MAIEFTVDHKDDVADDAGITPLIGWVTATVESRTGNYRVRDLGGPVPSALKLMPRKGYLAANGHMYKDDSLEDEFRLVANDPAFNLRELTYRFDFDLTTLMGVPVEVPFCRGPAPSSDTTMYLARVMNDLDQPVIEVRTKGYAEDILDITPTGIALLTKDLITTPYEFNAVGDGVADDSSAVQAAYNYLATRLGTPDTNGGGAFGTLELKRGSFKISSGFNAWHPHINIRGDGAVISGGEVVMGTPTYVDDAHNSFVGTKVSGITFDRNDSYGTSRGLVLKNCRGLTIEDCYFMRAGKGIAAEYGDGNTGVHVLGMIKIKDCRFAGLKYGIFTDMTLWTVCSDWHITGCFFNFCSVTPVWMWCTNGINIGGIDGLTFTGNTMFAPSFGDANFATKENCLKIGTSNWLVIEGNNFFESGYSCIYLDAVNTFTITGNLFAAPGQREAGDCIEIQSHTTAANGAISGNSFYNWTHAAIGLYGVTADKITIGPNGYKFTPSPSTWHGTGTIDLTTAFTIYQNSSSVGTPVVRESFGADSPPMSMPARAGAAVGCRKKSVSVTGATNIFTLGAVPYGGVAIVTATLTASADNSATYMLFLEGSAASSGTVTMLASSGLIAGSSSSWPSFTWSLSDGNLVATPVGSTSNTFDFHVSCLGALTLT